MSSRPPPPPPPPPSGPGSVPMNTRLVGGPPPPPPPPPGEFFPIQTNNGAHFTHVMEEEEESVIDEEEEDDEGLDDAFDEMMNLDTEQEVYVDEEEKEEDDQEIQQNSGSHAQPAMPPPPSMQHNSTPPPGPPRSPPPLPVSPPPPIPSLPPPPPHIVGRTSAQAPTEPSAAGGDHPHPVTTVAAAAAHHHEGLAVGAQVYVPELANVWGVATVTGKATRDVDSKLYHVKYGNGNKSDVDFAVVPLYPVNPQIMGDMTALHHIHEPGILYNLRHRFLTQKAPYTYMASALIAVNPLHVCPEPAMASYVNHPANQVAPHPYAIAEAAYQNLSFSKVNQSIVISGVSGAGKTETAKIILRYLAARSPEDTSSAARASTRHPTAAAAAAATTAPGSVLLHKVEGLDAKLVDSSPLLESFGNAKTLRNNNSSRFGKFLKLCFSNGVAPGTVSHKATTGMTLIGALVETYLLEKNRVITQGPGECNFHIFYQLLNSKYAQALYLKGTSFTILSDESVKLFAQIKEAAPLPAIEAALTLLGLPTSAIDNIWRILAGILHLTNIVFEEHESPEGNIAMIEHKSMTDLRYAAELWAVDQYALLNLLTKREMFTRGEAYLVQYTVKEANFARDATAKSVYEALFAYIVRAINRSLVVPDAGGNNPVIDLQKQYFVGVLDIFGFENFAHNGFEQLLINYANEALQNTFNEQLFEKELELFRSENIDFTVSECPNNRQCVQLIASRTSGLFKTLDSVSRQPKPSDERFCEELHKAFCTEKAYFLPVHKKDMRSKFMIKHYAGEVTYTVSATSITNTSSSAPLSASVLTSTGTSTSRSAAAAAAATAAALAAQNASWIIKNNDSIPDALATLYGASKLPEFRALAGMDSHDGADNSAADGGLSSSTPVRASVAVRRKSVMLKPTIVEIFSRSMDNLNTLLQSTTCQFVRCIKPNEAMVAGEFVNSYVMEQVRSLGILQACEVLKVSLPTRITYAQLKTSLAEVIRRVQHLFGGDSEVVLIACLLRAFNISTDLYRLGKTMVFFRPGQLARLEAMLTLQDATASSKNGDVIARIEESHAINQKGLALVRRAESNLEESELMLSELEKKFDRLSSKSKNLPEVRSLDIPEDVVQKISLIESFLASASRKHQALSVRLAPLSAALEDAKQMRGISPGNFAELARQNGVCDKEVVALARLLSDAREGYQGLNDHIQGLEEQCGGIGSLFLETIENNDVLYERIQDERNTCEDLTIRAKEQAERCQLEQVETLVLQAAEAGQRLKASMQELQRGIAVALAELERFENAADNVDFASVTQLAVGIINKLDSCQRGITNTETTVAQYERSLKTAKAGAAIEGVPPPRPTTQAPPLQTAGSGGGGLPERKPSINFSARDLAVLKQKRAGEDQAERISEDASTSGLSRTAASSYGTPAKPASGGSSRTQQGQQQQEERGDQLPPDWVEKLDKKSGRAYYVNEVTKARQWKRPVWETTAAVPIESAAATSEGVEDEDGLVSYVLPPGWKELVDKKTGRPYYVNSETKERQWRRPDNARKSTRLAESPVKTDVGAAASSGATDGQNGNRRLSRRFHGKQTPAFLTEEEGGAMSNKAANKVTQARRQSVAILEAESVDDDRRNTVSYMCRIGTQNKKGFLLKQGKFIGRWKRRYFVLSDDLLEYWDRLQDHALGRGGKTFFLSGACQTSFTSTQNCFCVSNPSDPEEGAGWYLLADTEEDMLDWMSAINAHIHVRYLAEWHITTDFWDRGNVETSFWKMPAAAVKDVQRRPVGIRSLPINDGPRTGEGIYPGEIVEVVQILEQPAARHVWAQRFLRLADDRGWVLENHPKANYAIMVPVPGTLIEDDSLRYVYSADCLEDLEIYNSPNCDEEHLTGLHLHPGAILRCVAVWTTSTAAVSAVAASGSSSDAPAPGAGTGETDTEDGNEELVFVKLADGKGWAPMYHPVTGGQLLSLVSAPPASKGVSTSNPTSRITPGNYDNGTEDEPAPQVASLAAPKFSSTTTATSASTKSAKTSTANNASASASAQVVEKEASRPALTKEKSVKKPAATSSSAAPAPPPAPSAPAESTKEVSSEGASKLKKAKSSTSTGESESSNSSKAPSSAMERYKESAAKGNTAVIRGAGGGSGSGSVSSVNKTAASAASGGGDGGSKDELNALQKPRRRVVKPISDS